MRPFESGRGVSSHHRPRVAQLRRAPLLQGGGWGFESLAADMPLKLSSAEQPPCKRKAVGSIPTWGFDVGEHHGSPTGHLSGACTGRPSSVSRAAKPPSGRDASRMVDRRVRHPLVAQLAEASGSEPEQSWFESTRGDSRCDVVQMAGRPAVTRSTLVRPQPSQLIPRSSNGRIFGSEPKDAWFESRPRSSYGRGHGVHAVSNTAGEGSIPSVRASRPGRLVGQDAGLSHR